MVNLLKAIYHKLSRFTIVKKMGELYLMGTPIGNYKAYKKLERVSEKYKKQDSNRKVRVAFVGQNVQVWGKIAPVYEKMIDDARFEVRLYAVKDITNKDSNETYSYFSGIYNNVIAVDSEGCCENGKGIKEFKPDYVFLTRPYDQYLPKEYRSDALSEYSKVCYCCYSFLLTFTTLNDCYSKIFARNVSLFFSDNKFIRNINRKRFKKAHDENVMKSVFLGYPIMSKLSKKVDSDNSPYFSVLWTPRWSQASEAGGGNMLRYKDLIVDYTKRTEDVRLIFRPHPLAFHHFVESGELSQDEVDAYRKIFDNDRFVLDEEVEYVKSFANADIIVSDISSMFTEFYISGKPIIYCHTGAKLVPVAERLLEGCYVTESWEETEAAIEKLRKGEDPLFDKRQEIIKEVFGENLSRIPTRFVEFIYSDFCEE